MLDPHHPLPLYHQLKQALVREIDAGQWRPHETIPTERELIDRYGVSRTTVRQALSDLVTEGVLYRRHGKGTYVAPPRPIVETLSTLTGHVEELQTRGLDPTVRVLIAGDAVVPPPVGAALALTPADRAFRVYRLVTVGPAPLLLIDAWLPGSLGLHFTAAELQTEAIYRLLEAQGIYPARGQQRIRAANATADEARLLGLHRGQAMLEVVRTVFSGQDQPIEWSRAVYHPDRYEYVVDLRRRGTQP